MPASLVVGTQWGDEGKAKVIDYLSKDIDIIVRYQGGANAGHTVVVEGKKYVFHLVPSGVIYPNTKVVIANGVVLDTDYFLEECDSLEKSGFKVYDKLWISDSCHIILPYHKLIDAAREEGTHKKIGTTKRGIGISYADKMMRTGFRVGDLLEKNWKEKLAHILEEKNRELRDLYHIAPVKLEDLIPGLEIFLKRVGHLITNTSYYLSAELEKGKKVLLEGAQGTGLDVDFGTYPYVTSSNPTTGGAIAGSGISYQYLKRVIGITKAYTTRVGEGPFPTELLGDEGEKLRNLGGEFGSTTGRPRRCGWMDIELLKHSIRVNGIDSLVLTKIDVLSEYENIRLCVGYKRDGKKLEYFPSQGLESVEPIYEEFPGWKSDIHGATKYAELPENCRNYIVRLQDLLKVKIPIISTGPDRIHTLEVT